LGNASCFKAHVWIRRMICLWPVDIKGPRAVLGMDPRASLAAQERKFCCDRAASYTSSSH
jgi:hypothetical protein